MKTLKEYMAESAEWMASPAAGDVFAFELPDEVLIETYTILKEYIPAKERQAAADNLISILVDTLSDKEIREFGGIDGYTKRSLEEYIGEDDEDEIDYEN